MKHLVVLVEGTDTIYSALEYVLSLLYKGVSLYGNLMQPLW